MVTQMTQLNIAPAGAKAATYDLTISLAEMNTLANVLGFILQPEEGAKSVEPATLQRIMDKLACAPRTPAHQADKLAELTIAAGSLLSHFHAMQDVMRAYLPPDGLTIQEAMGDLIERLDGPDQRVIEGRLRKALGR